MVRITNSTPTTAATRATTWSRNSLRSFATSTSTRPSYVVASYEQQMRSAPSWEVDELNRAVESVTEAAVPAPGVRETQPHLDTTRNELGEVLAYGVLEENDGAARIDRDASKDDDGHICRSNHARLRALYCVS